MVSWGTNLQFRHGFFEQPAINETQFVLITRVNKHQTHKIRIITLNITVLKFIEFIICIQVYIY